MVVSGIEAGHFSRPARGGRAAEGPIRYAAIPAWGVHVVRALPFILIGATVSIAIAAASDSGETGTDPAATFLSFYTTGKLHEAAQVLHCPETYTPAELKADREAVTRSLEIFVQGFGQIKSVVVSNSNLYVASMTACGTVPYWKKHPDTGTKTYETVNDSGDRGYVVFSFAEVDGRKVLSKFHQGLPASPGAIERVRSVLKLQMAK
jgi:hypothetical protein